MKRIILTSAIAILTGIANGQTTETPKEAASKPRVLHKLGLHAGTTSGTGLSYKVDYNDKYQFQITTLPVASQNRKWLNSGVQFRYKFRKSGNWDFLTYASASHLYTSDRYDSYEYDGVSDYYITERLDEHHQLNASAGLAFEYGRSDAFKFNIQTGYGGYDLTDQWTTMLTIGMGIDFTLNKL